MTDGYAALSDKEKQTLRLIVRGHDAKSVARHLDLSVHTVNERLRAARQKLSVSSSREAARLVFEREADTPKKLGDEQIGAARRASESDKHERRRHRVAWLGGLTIMSVFGAIALALLSQPGAAPAPVAATAPKPVDAAVVRAAQDWLALVDQGRWQDSWAATASSFRKMNTVAMWTQASQSARVPLGAMQSRVLISQESVPAPPAGVRVLKFRTSFAGKADAIETVSLAPEDGGWRVVGIYID